ncbi:MAG: DUF5916 domain-containing protein [Balneolaceae bacterium]
MAQHFDSNASSDKTDDIRLGTAQNPLMTAIKLQSDAIITLDGMLDEDDWQRAPVATEFTQRFPDNGRSASQKTEVRLLYTNDAIYVGFMAYDTAPDSIMAPLFRRDGNQPSDWVYVSFDSYNDSRTAFSFAVNPRGVQKDVLYYDDSNEDILWNAVWEAKTQLLENGWSAEIRIPLSQLRFNSDNNEQSWGVNFQRRIARNGEMSFWAPTSQNENRLVSRFGRLNGIRGLEEPTRLEIMPYAAGNLLRAPDSETGDSFYNRNQFGGSLGGDIRYGLTSDITLTATINPDFGQVEADPSVINLTANESFFSERRPFFLEGNDIFQFGSTKTYSSYGNPITFYSRRIGRAPQGSPSRAGENAQFTDQPDHSTIATAVKLSGKTTSGWSIGALNAFTLQENARYQTPSGTNENIAVEPVTNYLVTRTKKDFNDGNTYTGGFFSAVNRSINGTYFEDFLRSSAYLGGADFEHNFSDRNWVTSGTISYSAINGSEESINLAQQSPARYYNRVDSDKLDLDSGKTSLTGFATEMSLQKQGGDNWLGSITYSEVSPGYEINDMGFQNRADYRAFEGGVVYRDTNPSKLQYYEVFLFTSNAWNYDGDHINYGYGNGGFVRFNNQWTTNYNFNYNPRENSDRLTRGGPVMMNPSNINFNINVDSNPNRPVSFNMGTFQNYGEDGGAEQNYWAGVRLSPMSSLQISFSPEFILSKNMAQYIRTVEDDGAEFTYGNRYVFSEIDQKTLVANIRLDWTFSPTMSLQTYVRPFISSGKYSNFKELAAPRTFDFNRYGEDSGSISENGGEYTVDPDGTGSSNFTFGNPDFNFRSIQGNAVFRWEYRPGSTFYLVWQQQRDDFAATGNFDFGEDMGELFRSKPTNVFLVKASYWFGS